MLSIYDLRRSRDASRFSHGPLNYRFAGSRGEQKRPRRVAEAFCLVIAMAYREQPVVVVPLLKASRIVAKPVMSFPVGDEGETP